MSHAQPVLFARLRKVAPLFAAALVAWPFAVSHAEPPFVKTVWIDSQAIRFPAIGMDTLDYRGLEFAYATSGTTEVTSVQEQEETIRCDGQKRQNTFLKVDYRGPRVIFRITDGRDGRVLLIEERNLDGTTSYREGSCQTDKSPASAFTGKGPWLASLHNKLLADLQRDLGDFILEHAALRYEDLRFPLFYVQGDRRFERINQAADRAKEAFGLYQEYGLTLEAEEMLRAIASTWEAELATLGWDANLRPVRAGLHRNLMVTYFFLRKFDQARRHDAHALAHGQRQEDSWQKRILAHERHLILSPRVASDPVRMANVYRLGRNAVRDATLQHLNFDELERDLEQRSAMR